MVKINNLEQQWLNLLLNIKLGISIHRFESQELVFHNNILLSIFDLAGPTLEDIQLQLNEITLVISSDS